MEREIPPTDKVVQLCQAMAHAINSTSGRNYGTAAQALSFEANGLIAFDFDHEALRASLVGLARILVHPSTALVSLPDQRMIWAWCGQISLFTQHPPFVEQEWHLHQLAAAAIRARVSPVPMDLIVDANALADLLPYPLLEGMLRKACSAFVSFKGIVITQFDCAQANGKQRVYARGKRCNSIGDLLYLFVHSVAGANLRTDLFEIADLIAPAKPFEHACSEITEWRNGSLHGSSTNPSMSATVLTICVLILMDWVADTYHARRYESVREIVGVIQEGKRSPFCFFPIR